MVCALHTETGDRLADSPCPWYLLKSGELVVSGRVKDVIVLSNGENVEPARGMLQVR